jgi:hypothetical protein
MLADRIRPLEFRRLATRTRLRAYILGALVTKGSLRAGKLEERVRQHVAEVCACHNRLWRRQGGLRLGFDVLLAPLALAGLALSTLGVMALSTLGVRLLWWHL